MDSRFRVFPQIGDLATLLVHRAGGYIRPECVSRDRRRASSLSVPSLQRSAIARQLGGDQRAATVSHAAAPADGSHAGRTTIKQRLAVGPDAPRHARRLVEILGLGPVPRSVVTLLVSELVTNAVVHSGRPEEAELTITLTREGGFIAVEVWDRGVGFDWQGVAAPDLSEPGGLGLVLVDRLAERWGIRRELGGAVWFVYLDPTAG